MAYYTSKYSGEEIDAAVDKILDGDIGATGKRTARFTVGTSTAGWTSADCDYLCDGTADQTEINNAITALPATGGEIVILDGTYNITARISVRKNNVSIRGNGDATILKRAWNSIDTKKYRPIIYCERNNCLIQNFTLDGNKGAYTNSFNENIGVTGSNNTVTNISANNCASNSIWVGGSFNKIIYNRVLDNPNNSGIFIAGSFNIVCGNECRDNYIQINLNGANNNIVMSNICIRGTGLPSDYGSSYKTITLFESTSNYNLISSNLCTGKAVTNGGGTGNTLVNNKFDAT